MPDFSRRILLAAAGVAALTRGASAQQADGPAKAMDAYAAALRSNNLDAIVNLYTDDGVYIRPEFPPVIGRDALRAAYKYVFDTLVVRVTFDIKEVGISGDMAWLRSSSAGTVKELRSGAETRDAYNQIVVFEQVRGIWKIRNYIYAPANAATPART